VKVEFRRDGKRVNGVPLVHRWVGRHGC
jgi:hypothetical protein